MDPQALKKLQSEWAEKLKESGFEDIEDSKGRLKHYDINFAFGTHGGERYEAKRVAHEAKQEYYYQAGQFLTLHKFESDEDKLIWKMHSEGISCRDISKHIRQNNINPVAHKDGIQRKIKKLSNLMLKKG